MPPTPKKKLQVYVVDSTYRDLVILSIVHGVSPAVLSAQLLGELVSSPDVQKRVREAEKRIAQRLEVSIGDIDFENLDEGRLEDL